MSNLSVCTSFEIGQHFSLSEWQSAIFFLWFIINFRNNNSKKSGEKRTFRTFIVLKMAKVIYDYIKKCAENCVQMGNAHWTSRWIDKMRESEQISRIINLESARGRTVVKYWAGDVCFVYVCRFPSIHRFLMNGK